MTKFKILVITKNHDFPSNFQNIEVKPGFFIFKATLAFTKLRQVFIKAPIFHYFDSKCHIWIKTNVSKYVINRILSQLILNDLSE